MISRSKILKLKQSLLKMDSKNNAVFTTLGASSHSSSEREEYDYYATDPIAAKLLLQLESFNNILEPACGQGHLSKVFKEFGLKVKSSDLIYRGYGIKKDFYDYKNWKGDIITNPPFKYVNRFVEHALNIVPVKRKVAMFLKLSFLESSKRKKIFKKHPPKTIYVSSSRIICAKNGDFKTFDKSAIAYAWFVWEKGYQGETVIKWFN